MRTFPTAVAVAVALSTGAAVHAQGAAPPIPASLLQQIQKQLDDDVERRLPIATFEAMATIVGNMSLTDYLTFYRLNDAAQSWKKEKDAGAAPLLAEGVLFDCLGRLQGVAMGPMRGEDPAPSRDMAKARLARAGRAFDAALKIDPQLTEARMRAARIHAVNDRKAVTELEHIATETTSPLAYLAAINLGALAQTRQDPASATKWYERALVINPRSTAAAIGLSVLKPSMAVPFDALDADDLYYTYPCRVLTTDVATALAERARARW